jgi:hypothetical protein
MIGSRCLVGPFSFARFSIPFHFPFTFLGFVNLSRVFGAAIRLICPMAV